MAEEQTDLANRAEVLAGIEAVWLRFQASLAGLTAEDYERPGVDGVWSLKDTLGHMAGWYGEAIRGLEGYLRGRPLPSSYDVDAFNAAQVQLRSAADPLTVLDELRSVHGAWLRLLRRIPDEQFTTRLTRHWTVCALAEHPAEHAGAVRRAHELARSPN